MKSSSNALHPVNPFVYGETNAKEILCAPLPALLAEHYSQCGEDIILSALLPVFSRVQPRIQPETAIYVEIGANHPISGSNTYLLYRHGFRGILVEANPTLVPALQEVRPDDITVNAAITDDKVSHVDLYLSSANEISSLDKTFSQKWKDGRFNSSESIRVPAMNVNTLLERYTNGQYILLLSVDAEGLDLPILSSLDFERWRPAFIAAEPSNHLDTENAQKLSQYLAKHKYSPLARTEVNAIYCDAFLLHALSSELCGDKDALSLVQNDLVRTRLALRSCEASANSMTSEIAKLQGELLVVRHSLLWKLRNKIIKCMGCRVR